MIKFFRHIRQNLLNQGKTTKYFKYAIGKIFLFKSKEKDLLIKASSFISLLITEYQLE